MNRFLSVNNLSKYFINGEGGRLEVLKDVNFFLGKGETMSIIGPSGSGKSVLLQLLGGLDAPDAGEILINNVNILNYNDRQMSQFRSQKMGFIFQFNQLLPDFTALENVMLAALIGGQKKTLATQTAKESLIAVDMQERLNYKVTLLSGGEQQRVAFARALVNQPELILADEPTGSLDYKTGQIVINYLLKVVKNNNTSLILVTHNTELADLMDKSLNIKLGKVF